MNENWNSQIEQPESGDGGRTVFKIVVVLGVLLIAGAILWAVFSTNGIGSGGAATSDDGGGGGSTAWVAILPAILGGSVAANSRRQSRAHTNYTILSLIVGVLVLIVVGVALLIGFGVF